MKIQMSWLSKSDVFYYAGYWCEDYDRDIPPRPTMFYPPYGGYYEPPVPNVPELDMNRFDIL